ncbi:hypothetical protein [Fervidibacillus halotolerans]|uniref:Uncharacterized protein n=1 Tax=Fervidibacillus halotolerans TaxID=2980027 RepID=A0A9E8M0M3_9BACI|nr:hypothetical protein [Fervidibacillus halotolerans]WAA13182.1 hypothetical protein OE105_03365 [Fervidibacillus halotolerans]
MTVEHFSEGESRLSFDGHNFFVEERKSDCSTICLKLAVDNFLQVKQMLLEKGCQIKKEYGEKDIIVQDPFGICFHLFESASPK